MRGPLPPGGNAITHRLAAGRTYALLEYLAHVEDFVMSARTFNDDLGDNAKRNGPPRDSGPRSTRLEKERAAGERPVHSDNARGWEELASEAASEHIDFRHRTWPGKRRGARRARPRL